MNQIKKAIKELHEAKKPVHEVKIQIFADNRIEITGFPTNYHAAMEIMTVGMRRVANYFLAMAKEGKLDEKQNIIKSSIIEANKSLLGPDGKRLQ